VRLGATVAVFALLLAGTAWGDDDHFPFGPFRMYATTHDVNDPVDSTRLEAVNADGHRFLLSGRLTGFKRAELEGQLDKIRSDPRMLASLAAAYHHANPRQPKLLTIEVIVRHFELVDGRPTGEYNDTVETTWRAEP
jgi:hypothetical protein